MHATTNEDAITNAEKYDRFADCPIPLLSAFVIMTKSKHCRLESVNLLIRLSGARCPTCNQQ